MKQFQMNGYVCGQVNTRSTNTGKQVTSFSINSPERRKNQQTGEWESVAQFFECNYWWRSERDFKGPQIVEKAQLVIIGEPRYESWEKDGQKRSKVVFNVTDLWTIEGSGKSAAPVKTNAVADASTSLYDEDIPF